MTESTSSWAILKQLITSPKKAFVAIQFDYPVLLPLVILLIANAVLVFFALSNVDYAWFTEQMVEATAGGLSPSEQAQTRELFEMMSQQGMLVISLITTVLSVLFLLCLQALYFVIVSNFTHDGFQFKQWLSLVCWSLLPSIVSILAGLVVVFSNQNGQYLLESLDPFSLNSLFFGMDVTQGAGKVLSSISLTLFWSIALMMIGYSAWTKKSSYQSLAIIILPYLLFYGAQFYLSGE